MPEFLIWSEEHGAWWRPNRRGYTTSLKAAGRYTHADALAVCQSANGGGNFCEVLVEFTPAMAAVCLLPSGGR